MKKLLFTIMMVITSFQSVANDDLDIMMPINNMFDAMREHDSAKFLAQFTSNATLDRAKKDNSTQLSDLSKFADFIATSTKHLDEQLFNISIQQSGNLASVWTPFAFYVDEKLSHCGVNSFQLIHQDNQWKIHYLIDNSYAGNCEAFISEHKSEHKKTEQ